MARKAAKSSSLRRASRLVSGQAAAAVPAMAHVDAAALKPDRQHCKGVKRAAVLIEQQRRMFEPEISVTVWTHRQGSLRSSGPAGRGRR